MLGEREAHQGAVVGRVGSKRGAVLAMGGLSRVCMCVCFYTKHSTLIVLRGDHLRAWRFGTGWVGGGRAGWRGRVTS